ncbi:MAG: hypothetical protein Q7K37_01815 [Dehalococcoidia bacterium]|nr:hypothetical protein [Dehalococcoidia bacterium]
MDKSLRDILAAHIALECKSLLVFEGMLEESASPHSVWAAVGGALTTSAIIGRLLWGGKKDKWNRDHEHQELRDHLGVTDSSPFHTWLVRDHFEHIESRIEQWWDKRNDTSSAPLSFGTFSAGTWDVSFWNDRVNLKDLFDEARRILDRLSSAGIPTDG